MKKFLFGIVFLVISISAQAQCAMCRAALESEEGGVKAEAVNDGIVYLMAIPYILVGVLGYAIYRLKYGKKKEI
jgi:heme/copper-type cytochrome/quinol oxidase subunit 2